CSATSSCRRAAERRGGNERTSSTGSSRSRATIRACGSSSPSTAGLEAPFGFRHIAGSMNRPIDVATSLAPTVARPGQGAFVGALGPRPEKPLELYEFEGCPYCRKVREALSILDLEAVIYPCPKRGPRFRRELERRGGKQQFPYLVDPNTGQALYESDD